MYIYFNSRVFLFYKILGWSDFWTYTFKQGITFCLIRNILKIILDGNEITNNINKKVIIVNDLTNHNTAQRAVITRSVRKL